MLDLYYLPIIISHSYAVGWYKSVEKNIITPATLHLHLHLHPPFESLILSLHLTVAPSGGFPHPKLLILLYTSIGPPFNHSTFYLVSLDAVGSKYPPPFSHLHHRPSTILSSTSPPLYPSLIYITTPPPFSHLHHHPPLTPHTPHPPPYIC